MEFKTDSFEDFLKPVFGNLTNPFEQNKASVSGYYIDKIDQTDDMKSWFKVPSDFPYNNDIPSGATCFTEPILVMENCIPLKFVYVEASEENPIYLYQRTCRTENFHKLFELSFQRRRILCDGRENIRKYFYTLLAARFESKGVITLEYLMVQMYQKIHGSSFLDADYSCIRPNADTFIIPRADWRNILACLNKITYPIGYGSEIMRDGIKNMYLYDRIALKTDTILNSRYRIIENIGRGNFGLTYTAYDLQQNQEVVIKEFFMRQYSYRTSSGNIRYMDDADEGIVFNALQKFKGESRKISRISHPNIVKVLDSFYENETAYYVMPHLHGTSLYDVQQNCQNSVLPLQDALVYTIAIGKALMALHEINITHLDVKPENIIVTDDGIPILIDFGGAKEYDANEFEMSNHAYIRTPGYASPEQIQTIRLRTFCPKSDVFSLAMTLHMLLANTFMGVGCAIKTFSRSLDRDLMRTVKCATSIKIEQRPTMSEFVSNLECIYNGIVGENKYHSLIPKPSKRTSGAIPQ